MNPDVVVQYISTIGFPIAVCLICFWYIKTISEQHKEEVSKMTEAINNNTAAMNKVLDKLEGK